MPSKKKKYNARFPAGRIKKIMQSDEEVGKVAQAVPIIISRTLELFVESLLTKTLKITNSRNAKTLSTSHMKQCIMSEQRFDFLRELVRNIPDISVAEEAANYQEEDNQSSPEEQYPDSDTPYDLSMPSTSLRAGRQQQQQQQHTISNGHNGGGHHATQMHAAATAHEYPRTYLKRSMSSNPSSVIRHTTAMAQTNVDACLPAKLARSDSTPVPQHQQLSTAASLTTTMQHPRLKHQSYSMPTHMENSNNNNNNKPNTHTPLKTLRTPTQQTAIPAPIVNIDYCSKPVVKIDYSNLPLAGVTASANAVAGAPSSAPANIASTAFNFPAEPVINIDLSNIVASTTSAVPSIATISIGTPILPPPLKLPSSSSSSTTSCTSPSTLTSSSTSTSSSSSPLINKNKSSTAKTAVVEQQSRNSKAAMAEPFNSSSTSTTTTKATALAAAVAAATTMTTTISTSKKSDSYLDMDEDYDNI